jgi:fatty acid desaturase
LPEDCELLPGQEDVPQFEFDTPFARELKQEVRTFFDQKGSTKCDVQHWALFWTSHFLRVILYYYWFKLDTFGMICFGPALGYVFIAFVGKWTHDAGHFSCLRYPWINDAIFHLNPEMTMSAIWDVQHNINHHAYTNHIDRDSDLYSDNHVRVTEERPRNK